MQKRSGELNSKPYYYLKKDTIKGNEEYNKTISGELKQFQLSKWWASMLVKLNSN